MNKLETKSEKTVIIFLILILCYSSFFLFRNLSQNFNGGGSFLNAQWSIPAHNYNQYGIMNLRLGIAFNPEKVSDISKLNFHQHHPFMVPLLLSRSFILFGESEAYARLVPIIFTLGSILLVFFIASYLYGKSAGILSAFIFGASPGALFWGRVASHEAPTLFFILLSFVFYLNILEKPRITVFLGFFLAIGLGMLTGWPIYLMVPFFCIHYYFSKAPAFRNTLIIGLPVYALVVFAGFQYLSFLVKPDGFNDLLNQAMVYMGLIGKESILASTHTEAKVTFTYFQFIRRIGVSFNQFYPYPVLLFSVFGLYKCCKERAKSDILIFPRKSGHFEELVVG